MNVKHSLLVSLMLGLLALPTVSMANEAGDLLAKMRSAVHTLSYQGTLVYARGNELSTYQIHHILEGSAEKNSVIRLTQNAQGANLPAQESFSLAKFEQVQPRMEQVYALDVGGDEAVAGHTCRIVVARPRDRMRYLQRYCIDPNSGMLLKYALVDRSHKTVEQLMFTALTINPADGAVTAGPVSAVVQAELLPVAAQNTTAWSFSELPAGFQQSRSLEQAGSPGQVPVRQMILSDGMTSVSVFIANPDSPGVSEALSLSAGAMNIFTTEVAGHKVTLVGEVPVVTLESISKGLRHAR
jgi:sigma-E factor negative regulatory protein RseB